jgi:hypothetical protein
MLPKFTPAHIVWWDIVFAGARIKFLGSIEATDERDAIEKAVQEFKKTDPNKLLAVKRRPAVFLTGLTCVPPGRYCWHGKETRRTSAADRLERRSPAKPFGWARSRPCRDGEGRSGIRRASQEASGDTAMTRRRC